MPAAVSERDGDGRGARFFGRRRALNRRPAGVLLSLAQVSVDRLPALHPRAHPPHRAVCLLEAPRPHRRLRPADGVDNRQSRRRIAMAAAAIAIFSRLFARRRL